MITIRTVSITIVIHLIISRAMTITIRTRMITSRIVSITIVIYSITSRAMTIRSKTRMITICIHLIPLPTDMIPLVYNMIPIKRLCRDNIFNPILYS